jgi:vacuolar-type H+-ATPase subunit H
MATAKKAPAKRAPAKKTTVKNARVASFKSSADKAINIYLGVIGKSADKLQANIEQARKDNEKRVKDLETRGAKLRAELTSRFEKIELPEVDEVLEDAKQQLSKVQGKVQDRVEKVQGRVEEVVESVKGKLTAEA